MGRGRRTTTPTPAPDTVSPRGADAVRALAAEHERLRAHVLLAGPRIAELGAWPAYIDAEASLAGRIPVGGQRDAPGFDAGLAAALDLIPRERQRLAATLHAAYTPEAVAQARQEIEQADPDSETTWWLAACSVCREGEIDAPAFAEQLVEFERLRHDPSARLTAARSEFQAMRGRYEMRDGVPFATADGGAQGAYLDGHPYAGMYADQADLYFIGTYEESLGLEDFEWSAEVDEQGRARSGGVHGSKAFVKAANQDEYERAIAVVKARFAREG